MSKIGKNIKQIRMMNKMSQDDLAEKIFVSRQTVSNYETGKSNPDIDMIIRISEVFGTDANELIYGLPEVENRRKVMISIAIRTILSITFILVAHNLEQYATYLSNQRFVTAPLVLTKVVLWPSIFAFVGWTIMYTLHALTGAKIIKGNNTQRIHYLFLIILAAYVITYMPFVIWLTKMTIGSWIVMNSPGSSHSYGGTFIFIPLWDRLAVSLTNFTYTYPTIFLIIGAGLWLTKIEKKHKKLFSFKGVGVFKK